AAARLAATSRLASSAIRATRSRGLIARQTLTALCAPAASSGEKGPNTVTVGTRPGLFRLDHEGRHLAATRSDVGEARGAQAGEEAGSPAREDVRGEVDQHGALGDAAGLADRKRFAPHGDALLHDPETGVLLRLCHGLVDGGIPLAFAGLPAQGDAG